MNELKETASAATRAMLIGIRDDSNRKDRLDEEEAQSLSKELAGLAKTLGVEILERSVIRIRESQPKFGMGTGKAEDRKSVV